MPASAMHRVHQRRLEHRWQPNRRCRTIGPKLADVLSEAKNMKTRTALAATTLVSSLFVGCVSESKYDQSVKDANQARAEQEQTALDRDRQRDDARRLANALTQLRAECKVG